MKRIVTVALRVENWLKASDARAIVVALIVIFSGLIIGMLTDSSVVRYYVLIALAVFVGFLIVLDGYAKKLRKRGEV
jgi:ABC-type multidrug transport system permease subunit